MARELEPSLSEELTRQPERDASPEPSSEQHLCQRGLAEIRKDLLVARKNLKHRDESPGSADIEARVAHLELLEHGYQQACNLFKDTSHNEKLDPARLEAARWMASELEKAQQDGNLDQRPFFDQLQDSTTHALGEVRNITNLIGNTPGFSRHTELDAITERLEQGLFDMGALERAAGDILDPGTMFSILEIQKQVHNLQIEGQLTKMEIRWSIQNDRDDLTGRDGLHGRIKQLEKKTRPLSNRLEIGKQLMREEVIAKSKSAARELAEIVKDLTADPQKKVLVELANRRQELTRHKKELARLKQAHRRLSEFLDFQRYLEEALLDMKVKIGYLP